MSSAFVRIRATLEASAAAVPGEFRAAQFGSERYNSGNGANFSCQETISNAGQSHSAMRYGFAGGGVQYVLGVLCSPAYCAEPDEGFLRRGKRSGGRHADFGDSSPRQLATHVRIRVTPRSERLVP